MSFMHVLRGGREAVVGALTSVAFIQGAVAATTELANRPIFAAPDVPGNLALALSVEFPTAISVANLGNYADSTEYLGYFDPRKCYKYVLNTAVPAQSYFQPSGLAEGTNRHACSGKWSGNFMNWATMQAIDPFRWALTGGSRSVDEIATTILEKAWASPQGAQGNFPLRGSSTVSSTGNNLPASLIPSVTPFRWSAFNTSIWSRGNTMTFSGSGSYSSTAIAGADWNGAADSTKVYRVFIRVKVCDPSPAAGGLEANCVAYGSNYKPEGLMQKYAGKIRYSVFSFLNTNGASRQGGVMRAKMGFIGPTMPQPLAPSTVNPSAEWRTETGVMIQNPDATLAKGSGVANSGAMNFVNKFGQTSHSYMTYDAVSELYYAVLRYFRNQGNVPEWTNKMTPAELDGFPAPQSWSGMDPISNSCQKNFVLGIGDNNTHFDVNTGGGTLPPGAAVPGRTKPASVASDKLNLSQSWTNTVETLEGLTARKSAWLDYGSEYMAGLAYGAHVTDIRPDFQGTQTISTYWMDVMEWGVALDRNPYWLAAKYGGFELPDGYVLGQKLPDNSWNVSGDNIGMNGTPRPRPNNYFLAGNAAGMVSGLTKAFANIASSIAAYTTALSPQASEMGAGGTSSYASRYSAKGWTSTVIASNLTVDTSGTPATVPAWSSDSTLATQFAGNGWDTNRRVVTWGGAAGTPFRFGDLTADQQAALDTSYRAEADGKDYLDYLRGDRSQEQASTVPGSSKAYRTRVGLLGDIVNAKLTPVGPPSLRFSEAVNPGYAAFKTAQANRTPMVLAAANDGMLHVFNGSLSGSEAGSEIFSYVPSAAFTGSTGDTKSDGLVALGYPGYEHRFYVDATPQSFDVDFNRTGGTTVSESDWRTIVVGGLGKGGKSYYAIDITDPSTITDEKTAAGKVLWEFTDPTMGLSYGAPIMVKTRKYGWTLILTSGYNNSDGNGYLYFLNPKTGKLLEKVGTGTAAPGLTYATAYVRDYSDGMSDSVYVGDLNGRLWRFDIRRAAAGERYPEPVVLFQATDSEGKAQPITSEPLVEIHPNQKARYVMFGTGRLLDASDIASSQMQTFYAIKDGTNANFVKDVVTGGRKDLQVIVDVTSPPTIPSTKNGWYIDLGVTAGVARRNVQHAVTNGNLVAFATLLPTTDPCSPSGTSRVYVMDFGSGKSALSTAYVSFDSAVTDLRFVRSDGTTRLIAGTGKGEIKNVPFAPPANLPAKIVNWREITAID